MRMGVRWLFISAMIAMALACGSDEPSATEECATESDCDDGVCVEGQCEEDPSNGEPTGDGAYLEECSQDGDCASDLCITTGDGGRCSAACGGDGHCDEEPGWTCEELGGDFDDAHCFPRANEICAPCSSDEDCLSEGAECLEIDDGNHCGRHCGDDGLCPEGHRCEDDQCVPESESCSDCPEVDLATDVDNCGACGRECTATNASVDCVDADCVIDACDSGFDSCDGDSSSGCETHLDRDTDHCGSCGSACDPPNATGQCVNGDCEVLTCDDGYTNEDGDASTGCEAGCLADPVDVDIPNDDYVDQNCDGIHGTQDEAYFVAPNGNDGGAGSGDDPFATIQHAVDAADNDDDRWQVLVAEGTYEEQVELAEGVSMWGQYDADSWVRSPSKETHIASPQPVALIVDGYYDEGFVEGFYIESADADSAGHSSSRAVTLRGIPEFSGDLTLRNNTIEAGDGAQGAPGGDGADGDAGNLGDPGEDGMSEAGISEGGSGGSVACDGESSSGSGGHGGDGPVGGSPGEYGTDGWDGDSSGGDAGSGGSFLEGPTGCVNCCSLGNDGADGSDASSGDDGAQAMRPDGQADGEAFNVDGYDWRAYSGLKGDDGAGGGGGGGGGSGAGLPLGGIEDSCVEHSGAGGGGGGAGGCGGLGGEGGAGAGASIGIVTASAEGVSLSNNLIMTGDGGDGGAGGDGGLGGQGAEGRTGGTRSERLASDFSSGDGGDGGAGGDGGRGGGGSGGGGGMSTGILVVGNMSQSDMELEGNSFELGAPGDGGPGGLRGGDPSDQAQDGAAGIGQSIHEID